MPDPRASVVAAIEACGVVAVIRLQDPTRLERVVDALVAGGVRALEVTMTVPGAVDLIRHLAPRLSAEFLLGAGTVLDAATAERVIDAGARFVVSPVLRPDVIAAGHASTSISAGRPSAGGGVSCSARSTSSRRSRRSKPTVNGGAASTRCAPT